MLLANLVPTLVFLISIGKLATADTNVTVLDNGITWPTTNPLWSGTATTCSPSGKAHYAYQAKMSMSYSFTGTAIYMSILRSNVTGTYTVAVDSDSPVLFDGYSSTGLCDIQFGQTGLSNSQHTITVQLNGQSPQGSPTASGNIYLEIDSFIHTVPETSSSASASASAVIVPSSSSPAPVPSSTTTASTSITSSSSSSISSPSSSASASASTTAASTSIHSTGASSIPSSQTSSSSTTTGTAANTLIPSSASSESSAGSSKSPLKTSVIAGIAVAAAVVVFLVIFIFFFRRRSKRISPAVTTPDQEPSERGQSVLRGHISQFPPGPPADSDYKRRMDGVSSTTSLVRPTDISVSSPSASSHIPQTSLPSSDRPSTQSAETSALAAFPLRALATEVATLINADNQNSRWQLSESVVDRHSEDAPPQYEPREAGRSAPQVALGLPTHV